MHKLRNITIGQLLEEVADKYPLQTAVKYIEAKYKKTYSELNLEVDRVARGLMGMGFKKGDHIAVWATNYPEWLVLFFACSKIGVVLVTVNTNYKEKELEFLLKQSDSKALFLCDGLKDIDSEKIIYSLVPELLTQKKGELKSKRLPLLKFVVSFDNHYKGIYRFDDIEGFAVLVSSKEYEDRKNSLEPNDVINMQYTSGTTGFPKGVMLTHNNIVNNAFAIGDCMKLTKKDKLCIPVPFFHCFGLVLGILAAVTHASTMVPLLYFSPIKVMHAIEYEKCTALHGVPTMFISILEHRDFNKYDFSSLRTGIMAGSPCPAPVMKAVIEKMNLTEITIAFGQTESSPVCTQTTITDPIEKRINTVGKTLPFLQTKIVDPKTGKEVQQGEDGEFCVKGYSVMRGYYKMKRETDAVIDKDGWLHTGDVALQDKDGYYKITGRIKDVIIRGGENIFPKELEDFIYTHPKVKDVAIIAVPSKFYGEEVCAYIVKKDPSDDLEEKDIINFVAASLAKHKIPRYILFINKFPLTASGKIQKYKLRAMAKEALKLC